MSYSARMIVVLLLILPAVVVVLEIFSAAPKLRDEEDGPPIFTTPLWVADDDEEDVPSISTPESYLRCMRMLESDSCDFFMDEFCHMQFRHLPYVKLLPRNYVKALSIWYHNNQTRVDLKICQLNLSRCPEQTRKLYDAYEHDDRLWARPTKCRIINYQMKIPNVIICTNHSIILLLTSGAIWIFGTARNNQKRVDIEICSLNLNRCLEQTRKLYHTYLHDPH
ncbi:5-methylcytosine-specific restriction enzyme B [Striga asiatica]|uniref:5-methylcytosine-specific restriction enzyme B n=1 Tax=Striga asiatica TaxID=4170 RepID=A0A5A7RKC4_STRAF|nr:5-methylcytosine-specific restriction enzyme B [Striga asiatica]